MNFFSTLLLLSLIMTAGTVRAEVEPRIAAGGYHSVALKADGTVWTWGFNASGQLGNGTNASATLPQKISFQNYTATAVSAGESHTLMLLNDGTVRAWGGNESGQLGNNTVNGSPNPVQVVVNSSGDPLTNIVAIAAGAYHSMAIKNDSGTISVLAWGDNSAGQLGNGSSGYSTLPVQATGLTGVTALSAGQFHSVALKSDGTVWTWGSNMLDQLGRYGANGTPAQVTAFDNGVTAVAAGGYHTVALKSNGTVWAWGKNDVGQIGNYQKYGYPTVASPVQVIFSTNAEFTNVEAIAAGESHSVARKSDSTVWMWGKDHPVSSTVNSREPVQYTGITDASQIAVGKYHTMALNRDGIITSWGFNNGGQLGRGFSSVVDTSTYPVLGFNIASACRAMIGESCYQAVADAYNSAADSATILVMTATLYEPLEFSRSIDVTLSGSTGSEIRGPLLTISTGSLVIGSNMSVIVT